ncbi:MAG TPA: hypothetical protein VGD07_17875 [Methylomirabilota bacterium]
MTGSSPWPPTDAPRLVVMALAMVTVFVASSTGVPTALAQSAPVTYSLQETSRIWPDSGVAMAGPPERSRIVERGRELDRVACERAREDGIRTILGSNGAGGTWYPDGGRYRVAGRVIETRFSCVLTGQRPDERVAGAVLRRMPRWLVHLPNLVLLAAGVFWFVGAGPIVVTAWRTPIPPVESGEPVDRRA